MAMAGTSDVYSASNDLLQAFLGLQVSVSQVYRVTNALGEAVAEPLQQPLPAVEEHQWVYASMDGSMLLTDEGWQEVKLGRVFGASARVSNGQQRFRLSESLYSGHLGHYQQFLPKFEASLAAYAPPANRLVFITDGAQWIQQYLERQHPQAIHILDYYHALEHLAELARVYQPDAVRRRQWLEQGQLLLKSNAVGQLMEQLGTLPGLKGEAARLRDKVVSYYEANQHRMAYGNYLAQGLMIGSGPMEAAHRTVIQSRMKRSGQRWVDRGAQALINLRVVAKSKRWSLITDLLKNSSG